MKAGTNKTTESAAAPRDWNCQQMAIISAEYDEEKEEARAAGNGQRINLAIIARRHGVTGKQLKNWRANHLSACRATRCRRA